MFSDDVFFHNPGPTNIPSSVLDAIRRPVIDYRGFVFAEILQDCLSGLSNILKTRQSVVIMPASGHGAWEAALVNLFSPGDKVLVLEIGYFSNSWGSYARKLGLDTLIHRGDSRNGVDYCQLEQELAADKKNTIKGILVAHCETSTGLMTDIARIRQILDKVGHKALLLVDVISSLGCADFRMDAWGVDIAAGAVQKGLMMPTGLCFAGISKKALQAIQTARLPRAYFDWREMLIDGRQENFAGTAPVQMFYGLKEALRLISDEGLDQVLQRHDRYARAVRAAIRNFSAEKGSFHLYLDEEKSSPSLTTIIFDNEGSADRVRATALKMHKVQLGAGIGELKGKVLRLGHMGRLHNAHLIGTLAGLQMAMLDAGLNVKPGGLDAAINILREY